MSKAREAQRESQRNKDRETEEAEKQNIQIFVRRQRNKYSIFVL